MLGQYGTHRLPVTVRTTTGEAPALRVLEVEDGSAELGTLYFTAEDDGDDNPATVSGYLTIVGNALGAGVIHIVDTATNTTYPVVYRVEASGDGINIFNDDTQFTFYNADGQPFDPDQPNVGQDWLFQDASSWTDAGTVPYLSNLSFGQKGASFTFTTQGSEFAFDLIGTATVTSNRFPGTYTISGSGANPTSETVDFGETAGVTHTVTVTITSEEAWFDVVRVGYTEGYTPNDDANAPGLYWNRSFPVANSVQTGTPVELTVYAVDDSGLQNLALSGDCYDTGTAVLTRTADGLWAYTFTVTGNGSFQVQATDTSGNTTTRTITVDWFADVPQNEPAGTAPALEASIWKDYPDGASEQDVDLFADGNETIRITEDERQAGIAAEIRVTNPTGDLTYTRFSGNDNRFVEQTNAAVNANGYYMVRVDANDGSGTWRAQIFYVDRFDAIPEVVVEQATGQLVVNWRAEKDDESTALLNSVMLNGSINLLDGVDALAESDSYMGSFPIQYGGTYEVVAKDTNGTSGSASRNLTVPVSLSGIEVEFVNPWGQPEENGAARHGTVEIQLEAITGGDYVPESAQGATSLSAYYGSYEYLVLTKEAYEAFDALTDGEESALSENDAWKTIDRSSLTLTWDELQADTDGMTYVLLVRDAQNPEEYSTMASHEFTLTDNAIDNSTSPSASLASTPTTPDGRVYISAIKGQTGYYEFAILPVKDLNAGGEAGEEDAPETEPNYEVLTMEDFRDAEDLEWVSADDWSAPNAGVLEGLAEGRYQVAIRALVADAADVATLIAADTALKTAERAVETLQRDLESAVSAQARNIATLQSPLMDAELALEELMETGSADDAAIKDARDAVTAARKAYEAALVGFANAEDILDLREIWRDAPEGEERGRCPRCVRSGGSRSLPYLSGRTVCRSDRHGRSKPDYGAK